MPRTVVDVRYNRAMRLLRQRGPGRVYSTAYRLRAKLLRRLGHRVCPCGKCVVDAGATVRCEDYVHDAKWCRPAKWST